MKTIVLGFSSALGLGYMPKAPGTFGTLAALPLWWVMSNWHWMYATAFVVAVAVFSIWISSMAEAIYGGHDCQKIVIDEVAGMLVGAIGVPFAWPQVLAGFILFRLFDALKPPPIRWFDENVDGGLGVVVDDLAAGVATLVCMYAAKLAFGGWWTIG